MAAFPLASNAAVKVKEKKESLADECPKCGYTSYQGGHCFRCGAYRPSKHTNTEDVEGLDAVDYMQRGYGTRVRGLQTTEEQIDQKLQASELRFRHRDRKKPLRWKSVVITESNAAEAAILVQVVVEPYGKTKDGQLVRAVEIPWRAIVDLLKNDWKEAFKISPRTWEELIAAAFDKDGYDEVTLTPRSGDHGRDVIAVRKGVGCIRIIDSVKAYKPGHLVKHDDVRALAGVLSTDHKSSKGILTTTSDFAPGIIKDPYIKPLIPYRLELMNGTKLREWLASLAK
jgi:restriction endonuclease Mrr